MGIDYFVIFFFLQLTLHNIFRIAFGNKREFCLIISLGTLDKLHNLSQSVFPFCKRAPVSPTALKLLQSVNEVMCIFCLQCSADVHGQ